MKQIVQTYMKIIVYWMKQICWVNILFYSLNIEIHSGFVSKVMLHFFFMWLCHRVFWRVFDRGEGSLSFSAIRTQLSPCLKKIKTCQFVTSCLVVASMEKTLDQRYTITFYVKLNKKKCHWKLLGLQKWFNEP